MGGVRSGPDRTTPLPERATVLGDEGAVLVIVSVPLDVTCNVGANVTFRFRLWFGLRTVLPENPLTAKGVLVWTELTVTDVLPVFVTVIAVAPLVVSTFWFPKFTDPGETVIAVVCATPEPESGIDSGVLAALLAIETEPVKFPIAVGANSTLKIALFPAAITCDAERPVMLKPFPETLACEIVTSVFPPLDSWMLCELLLPMATLPKLAVDGMVDNWPCVPVPLKETVRGEFDASLEMEALPVTAPADCGANCI